MYKSDYVEIINKLNAGIRKRRKKRATKQFFFDEHIFDVRNYKRAIQTKF